jgi:hypothetical protein
LIKIGSDFLFFGQNSTLPEELTPLINKQLLGRLLTIFASFNPNVLGD